MPTLNWIGKDAVIRHHKKVPFRLLEPDPALSHGDAGRNATSFCYFKKEQVRQKGRVPRNNPLLVLNHMCIKGLQNWLSPETLA